MTPSRTASETGRKTPEERKKRSLKDKEAAGNSRQELRELFQRYIETRDPKVREKLILKHLNLVRFLAAKFANRGESLDDLIQVGTMGLIKAIDRYDSERGAEFSTYATPNVVGEIKRYFRDKGSSLRVPRRLQELSFAVSRAVEDPGKEFSRSPTVSEIASKVGATEEEVLEAQELGQAVNPLSLERRPDLQLEKLEDKLSLEKAFSRLTKREQIILYFRFYENLSQNEIAQRLEVHQMQVSRLQQKALDKLRLFLLETREDAERARPEKKTRKRNAATSI
ncbi:MAG: sigma-70 family RNA polymerase sigma factor [Armatimonadetes bacterium]|nr:sigma-70 family RNA polymerase sigma factor [Armatimonadota bacterium]